MTTENENPELTHEKIERLIKLEAIFMHSRRQREEAYRNQGKCFTEKQPIRLVHYTSAAAALSIIKSKCIWMRNATCMADYQEVQHGFDILYRFFPDGLSNNPFVRALDACVQGAATEAINTFNQWWQHIRFNFKCFSVLDPA